jgi:hypothetical protein
VSGGRQKRWKEAKAKRERGQFCAIPHSVLDSQSYARLSTRAVKLLLDVARRYNLHNNGDLSITWKLMRPRGWNSPVTLRAALTELLASGFLCRTRQGRRPNLCSLYAITWYKLDPSNKYDALVKTSFVFGAWKANEPVPDIKPKNRIRWSETVLETRPANTETVLEGRAASTETVSM